MAGTDNTMTIDQQNMTIDELKAVLQEYGIAGAGGAGFPSYGKISDKIELGSGVKRNLKLLLEVDKKKYLDRELIKKS